MADITFRGTPAHTRGNLPKAGDFAPNFVLVSKDLQERTLLDYRGSRVILNIFPSIDTGVCATSVIKFNHEASNLLNTKILCISKDLPFAMEQFCGAKGIASVEVLSDYRSEFSKNYPVEFIDTPLQGLLSRCILVLDENGRVIYAEQVQETGDEPNYEAVFKVLGIGSSHNFFLNLNLGSLQKPI